MDLLHDREISFLRSQYAGAMVTVSVVTYVVAIGLVLFVDRRKVKPFLVKRLSNLGPSLSFQGKEKTGSHEGGAKTDKPAFWSTGTFNLRQRRGKGKGKGKAVEGHESGAEV